MRYEGTSQAATEALMIGVPLPELETDDTGVEGGLCVEKHGTATVFSDS